MKGQAAYLDEIISSDAFMEFIQNHGYEYSDFEPYMFDKNNPEHKKLYEDYIETGHNPEKGFNGVGVYLQTPDNAYDIRKNITDAEEYKEFTVSNWDVVYDLLASQKKENGQLIPEAYALRKRALDMIRGGADKYAIRIMLIRAINCNACVKSEKGCVKIDQEKFSKLQPEEQERNRNYLKGCMNAEGIVDSASSPYDRIFEIAKEIEELKREENKKINLGLDAEYIQDKVQQKEEVLASYMSEFDPDMLARVLKSKKELEVEQQKHMQGYTEADRFAGKQFIVSSTVEYSACNHVQRQINKMMKERAQASEK